MRILIFFTAAVFLSSAAVAQTSFGFTAGYVHLGGISTYEGATDWKNASGSFAGVLAEVSVTEALYLQPGLSYASIENTNLLYFPFLVKYYLGTSDVNLQAGPQASIVLDEVGAMDALGIDLGFGAGYALSDHFFLEARYFLEVSNRISAADVSRPGSPKARINSLLAGIGYKF